jgi:hypothetical protein
MLFHKLLNKLQQLNCVRCSQLSYPLIDILKLLGLGSAFYLACTYTWHKQLKYTHVYITASNGIRIQDSRVGMVEDYVHDVWLPSRCKWDLRSSEMLRSGGWSLVTDGSEQPIGAVWRGPSALECLTPDKFSKKIKYRISWKSVHWEPICSLRADRRTDLTKLVVSFPNFWKAPINSGAVALVSWRV